MTGSEGLAQPREWELTKSIWREKERKRTGGKRERDQREGDQGGTLQAARWSWTGWSRARGWRGTVISETGSSPARWAPRPPGMCRTWAGFQDLRARHLRVWESNPLKRLLPVTESLDQYRCKCSLIYKRKKCLNILSWSKIFVQ